MKRTLFAALTAITILAAFFVTPSSGAEGLTTSETAGGAKGIPSLPD